MNPDSYPLYKDRSDPVWDGACVIMHLRPFVPLIFDHMVHIASLPGRIKVV